MTVQVPRTSGCLNARLVGKSRLESSQQKPCGFLALPIDPHSGNATPESGRNPARLPKHSGAFGHRVSRKTAHDKYLISLTLGGPNLSSLTYDTSAYLDQGNMAATATLSPPSVTPPTYHRIVSPTLTIPVDPLQPIPVGLLACQRKWYTRDETLPTALTELSYGLYVQATPCCVNSQPHP